MPSQNSTAVVISRGPLHPNEPPMVEVRNFNKTTRDLSTPHAHIKDTQGGGGESHSDGVRGARAFPSVQAVVSNPAKSATSISLPGIASGDVIISSDLTMATDLRAYKEWPGKCY